MKPRQRIADNYLRMLRHLETLMARAEKKLRPAEYQLLDRSAAQLVERMSETHQRHVEFVDHLVRLIGETPTPPPPSPPSPRRTSRPPRHAQIFRFTLNPPRRSAKKR